MKTNMTLFTVLISSLCILEMLIYPINIRADETFMAYCHNKTGEIFYEEEFKLKSKQFDRNDVEVIYLNVKPCRKRKENMSEEELGKLIPVTEAITCILVEQMGYKLFKTTEEYLNGGERLNIPAMV